MVTSKYNDFQIAGYAKAAGFPDNELATAVAVALAESGGNTMAVNRNSNGSSDYGLWQINTIHGPLLNQGDKFNPLDNAKMALVVWQRAGNKWTPWTVYKSGAYRTFLLRGSAAAMAPVMPGTTVNTLNPTPNAPIPAPWDPPIVGPDGEPIPGTGTPGQPGALDQVTGQLTSLVDTIKGINTTITTITTTLLSGGFWLRIGAFVVGALLVVVSLIKLTGAQNMVPLPVKVPGL